MSTLWSVKRTRGMRSRPWRRFIRGSHTIRCAMPAVFRLFQRARKSWNGWEPREKREHALSRRTCERRRSMFSISAWEARYSEPIRRTPNYTHLRTCSSKRWKPRMFRSALAGTMRRDYSMRRRCSGQMRRPWKSGGRFIWEWICLLHRERRFALRSMASCIFWRKIRRRWITARW